MAEPRGEKKLREVTYLDGIEVKPVYGPADVAGLEVIYSGLRRSAEEIVAEAVQEDVDVIGLSVLSGAHLTLSRKLLDRLRGAGADDIAVVVGGTIPARDAEALRGLGVSAVFPMGTPLPEIVTYFRSFRRGEG